MKNNRAYITLKTPRENDRDKKSEGDKLKGMHSKGQAGMHRERQTEEDSENKKE